MPEFKDDPRYKEFFLKYCRENAKTKSPPYVRVMSVNEFGIHLNTALVMWKPPSAEKYEILELAETHRTKAPAISDARRLAKELGIEFRKTG